MGPILPWGTNLRAALCLKNVLHLSSCIPGRWACLFHFLESPSWLPCFKAFCKGFLMTFQLPRQPQQASDLSGKSPFSSCLGKSLSQPFSKCGLVASASPRTVRSKNLQPWRLYLGHSNLCFKKSSRGSPRMLKIKNPKNFNTYSKLKEQHMPKVWVPLTATGSPTSFLSASWSQFCGRQQTMDSFQWFSYYMMAGIKLANVLRAFFCFSFFSVFCWFLVPFVQC